jgi:alcohol dehydrogenase (cytochrome c)
VIPLTAEGVLVYPGVQGATNWYSPAYSPRTGLFYVPSWAETYSTFTKRPVEYREGQRFTGALPAMPIRILQPSPVINRRRPEDGYGAIQAIDPKTGDKKWDTP